MYERWPFIFAFFISASYCYALSIDEALRPKDSYFVVNRIEESGIKETIDQHVIKKRSADPPNITVNVSLLSTLLNLQVAAMFCIVFLSLLTLLKK